MVHGGGGGGSSGDELVRHRPAVGLVKSPPRTGRKPEDPLRRVEPSGTRPPLPRRSHGSPVPADGHDAGLRSHEGDADKDDGAPLHRSNPLSRSRPFSGRGPPSRAPGRPL